MAERIRVVIADDHVLMRRGLRMTLEEVGTDFELVGEASDGPSVLRLVEQVLPDVVLMDIRMPGLDGLEALEQIKAAWPHMAVVILTTYNEDELVLGDSALEQAAIYSRTATWKPCSQLCVLPHGGMRSYSRK